MLQDCRKLLLSFKLRNFFFKVALSLPMVSLWVRPATRLLMSWVGSDLQAAQHSIGLPTANQLDGVRIDVCCWESDCGSAKMKRQRARVSSVTACAIGGPQMRAPSARRCALTVAAVAARSVDVDSNSCSERQPRHFEEPRKKDREPSRWRCRKL